MTELDAELAAWLQDRGVGVFATADPASRTIFVGEAIQTLVEGLTIIAVPSPPPEEYIDHEYIVLDFWSRSPHSDRARAKLRQVYDLLHRRYNYDTANWHVYFSRSLGAIVDADRDGEFGKLFRLSVQFICRNLNNIS